MELTNLPKTTRTRMRRLGQGHGSGRGKTAGRGTKGQKARGKVKLFFEGGALPLVKRIPFLRGRGKNKVIKAHPLAVDVKNLNKFKSGSSVDVDFLVKAGVVSSDAKKLGAKIIGDEDLNVALTVKIQTSAGAKKRIEKAGGKVEFDTQTKNN